MRHFVLLTALALCSACQPAPKTRISSEGAASEAAPAAPAAGLSAEDEAAIRAKKQPDGSWKVVYDMWSSNAPAGK